MLFSFTNLRNFHISFFICPAVHSSTGKLTLLKELKLIFRGSRYHLFFLIVFIISALTQ
jgi:hypothetical protein